MMNNADLKKYINDNIPMSIALGVEINEANTDKVILGAPIFPNINHKKTVFGGSLHSVATLSCWSLIFLNLQQYEKPTEIVISESHIKYLSPVNTDFTVECNIENKKDLEKFWLMLRKKGKGRIQLNAKIYQGDKLAVTYHGEFAAITKTN